MVAPTTPPRVSLVTRDRLMRAQMRADAKHARADADDLAEVRRVQAELDEIIACDVYRPR
jgi:hypothetical protein